MKNTIVIILILFTAVAASGQNKYQTGKRVAQSKKQLAPVEAYVRAVKYYVDEVEMPDEVIANVADYNNATKPEWKYFDSLRAYEEADVDSYETYFVWKINGKTSQVNVTYSSPSGDWVHYVYHTFYPNGSAAKIERDLRTFMGDIIVNRVGYYNRRGKLLAKTESYRDLTTQNPIKKPESFIDIDVDVYRNVAKLPFRSTTAEYIPMSDNRVPSPKI